MKSAAAGNHADAAPLSVRSAAWLIALAALAAYANSFGGAYVFDDVSSLVNNPTIRSIGGAFFPPDGGITVSGRPVLNASFAISYALGGGRPWAHHMLNFAVHLAAGLTLFGLVRRTLGLPSLAKRFGSHATALGFGIALLWTLHPLQTESVTYIVQRAESLMGLLFLFTIYAYLRGTNSAPGTAQKWYAASIGACLLGIGTKEVIVVVPVLVLLHDRAFVAGSLLGAWRARRSYYLALFGTWIPLAALVLANGGNRGGTSGFGAGVSAMSYWLTQFEALTRYLALSFWPHPLIFEYGTFWTQRLQDAAPFAALIVPLAVLTLWLLWKRPKAGFLGAWFFAILAPTSLMPGTLQMIVEHRMYLPLAAVLVVVALATWVWHQRAAYWLCLAAALAFGMLSVWRNADYQQPLRLWNATLARRPDNPAAIHGVGISLLAEGRAIEAVPLIERAVALDPTRADYKRNLGGAENGWAMDLLKRGDTVGALAHFERAIQLAPGQADYRSNRAGALVRSGRVADAIAEYEAALQVTPRHAEVHSNLGLILAEAGRVDEAIAHGEVATREAPRSASAFANLGVSLLYARRAGEAVTALETSLRIDAGSAEAHNSMGVALIQLNRAAEALPHFEAALRLKPDYPQARDNLARLQSMLGGSRRVP